ncbi:MAG: glycosyltransferase [Kiritimatiellae bacterium]|nr:glycosyltransferase [Kiritimatiellia bacterium]
MNFPPTSIATLFRLLRRDGFSFFGKCARYAFSRDAWFWLLRGGRHVAEISTPGSDWSDKSGSGPPVRTDIFGPMPDLPAEERERSRRVLAGYSPKISIVVASYNYAHLIGETLDALEAQTYRNFEVLVIDNASQDNSVEVIEKYVKRDSRFSLTVHEVNLGLPGSVKHGIDLAKGEFVAFCEADDIWSPDHLEKKVELLRAHWGEPDFIINDIELFGDLDRCREVGVWLATRGPALAKTRNRIPPLEFRRRNWICTFSICMVRRDVIRTCDFDSVPRPSNLDWWLWRQICFDHDVWVVHEKLTKWRLHKDSYLMRDGTADRMADLYDLIAKMDRFLVERHPAQADSLRPLLRPEDAFACAGGRLSLAGAETRQPFFSVLVSLDGATAASARTLASTAAQTYSNFEVVPFSSAVPSGDVAKALADPRLDGRVRLAADGATAATQQEAWRIATGEWIVGPLPGDVLRPEALQTFAARIVLDDSSAGVCGKARCMRSGLAIGGNHKTAAGAAGSFAVPGAFAVRRDGGGPGAPYVPRPFAHPCLELVSRLFSTSPVVFFDHLVVLNDDTPDGPDPSNRRLDAAAEEFFGSARTRPPFAPPSVGDIAAVSASPLFDGAWYLRENPDVALRGENPANHYACHGLRHPDRNPGPDFVGEEYLALNPDVRLSGVNPLVHYERSGRAEGRPVSFLQTPPPAPFPAKASEGERDFRPRGGGGPRHRRVALFAAYSGNGRIPETTLVYLRGLRAVCDETVFVMNAAVLPGEAEKLDGLVRLAVFRPHGEYDFGSWRTAFVRAREAGLLAKDATDELVLANDSCFGPVFPFEETFAEMAGRSCDFWGLTANTGFTGVEHLQSYFLVLRRRVLDGPEFGAFLEGMRCGGNRWVAVMRGEAGLTAALSDAGYAWEALVPRDFAAKNGCMPTKRPLALMEGFRVPLVKAKALTGDMADDRAAVVSAIRRANPDLADAISAAPPKTQREVLPARLRVGHQGSFAEKAARIAARAVRGERVRALFIVTSPSMFPARPLFDAMRADRAFDARVFVAPDLRGFRLDPGPARAACRAELEKAITADAFLEGEPDAMGLWTDVIGSFGADIVCYPSPYDVSSFPYNPHWAVGRDFLPIHVNYGFYRSVYDRDIVGRQNYAWFWKAFFECEATAKEYAEHSILKGANAEVVGYVKMDALAAAKPWPRNGSRKRVLIAPHHSVEGGANDTLALSNFQRYADFFLALPERHPEIDFVFRPHPFLFTVLSNPSKWGRAKVDDWIARMKAHPNIRWSDEGDYFPVFASCDACVQDCGSYLVEWFYTGKPCCYLLKDPSDIDAKFAPLGKDCLSHCYLAYDEAAIESFLRDVVEGGNDPKSAARNEFRKSVMVNYPHAAEAALASIKKALGME